MNFKLFPLPPKNLQPPKIIQIASWASLEYKGVLQFNGFFFLTWTVRINE